MLKVKSCLVIAALVASLSACGGGPPRVVKSPDSVMLTENDITDRPYQIVQDLDVWVHKPHVFADDPTREQVAAELKKKAAELNADAVILVRYGTVGMGVFNWGEIEGKGRAVVFK
jgi:hypothetical protein